MQIKKSTIVLGLVFLIATQTGCDNDSNAQQQAVDFTSSFSGSFVSTSENTDTNKDGRPAFIRTYKGKSNLGKITINTIDEFAQPIPPVTCPEGNQEFLLVRGSFVYRVENGDLLLGELESGISCFDPVKRNSVITLTGNFTEGTGGFANISGSVEMKINSMFLNTTAVNGFASGGSTGTATGTINLPNGGN